MIDKTKTFHDLLEKIKNRGYELSDEDLSNLQLFFKDNKPKAQELCFDIIQLYYNDNELYLENEEKLTSIISKLLSFMNPDELDEKNLYEFIFHNILVNRSKQEDPQRSLSLIDQYLPNLPTLSLKLMLEKTFIYHHDMNDSASASVIFKEVIADAERFADDKVAGELLYRIGRKYASEWNKHESCAEAIKYFQDALSVYSQYNDPESLFMQGKLYFKIGSNLDTLEQYDDAISNFLKAKDLYEIVNKNTGVILHHLASAYQSQGKLDHAIKYYQNAIDTMDENETFFKGDSFFNLGRSYWDNNQKERALELLEYLVEKFTSHPLLSIYQASLGTDYMISQKYDKAIDIIYNAIKNLNKKEEDYTSSYIEYITRIAECHLEKGEFEEGNSLLDKILNTNYDDIALTYSLSTKARGELMAGNTISALRYIKKTRLHYKRYKNNNNVFLETVYTKSGKTRNYIFKERSAVFAILYPFL